QAAEREEPPLEQRYRVFGAHDQVGVAAELIAWITAQVADATDRVVLMQRQVIRGVAERAELDLMLAERHPAVVRAQVRVVVAVAVESRDARLEHDLRERAPRHAETME